MGGEYQMDLKKEDEVNVDVDKRTGGLKLSVKRR